MQETSPYDIALFKQKPAATKYNRAVKEKPMNQAPPKTQH